MSQALQEDHQRPEPVKTTAIFISQLREKIGVMFGSPETTTGGRALKFYASVRIDIRRIERLSRTARRRSATAPAAGRQEQVARAVQQAEFDILYGEGISREAASSTWAWSTASSARPAPGTRTRATELGQGKENARNFLKDNPDLANESREEDQGEAGRGRPPDAPAGRDPARTRWARSRRPRRAPTRRRRSRHRPPSPSRQTKAAAAGWPAHGPAQRMAGRRLLTRRGPASGAAAPGPGRAGAGRLPAPAHRMLPHASSSRTPCTSGVSPTTSPRTCSRASRTSASSTTRPSPGPGSTPGTTARSGAPAPWPGSCVPGRRLGADRRGRGPAGPRAGGGDRTAPWWPQAPLHPGAGTGPPAARRPSPACSPRRATPRGWPCGWSDRPWRRKAKRSTTCTPTSDRAVRAAAVR